MDPRTDDRTDPTSRWTDGHVPHLGFDQRVTTADTERVRTELAACAVVCQACAAACLHEDDAARLVDCATTDILCADVCEAAARVLHRDPALAADIALALLNLCVLSCQACAQECERHADHHDHCARCAAACRRCEDACKDLLQDITARAA